MVEKKAPFVSVIIPTYNDWSRLALCIDALRKQTTPVENFEIIIVNNDKSDIVPNDFKLPINGRLIHEPSPGSYAARNTAISIANGDILAFTDSDCIPDRMWISNALRCFTSNSVSRVGGKVEIFCKNPEKPTVAELYESMFAFNQKRNVEKFKCSITANLFAYKKLFVTAGLFDSKKKSGEDFGWNKRVSALGIDIIYGEDVIVRHPARRTLKELSQKKRRVLGGKNFKIDSINDAYQISKYLPRMLLLNLFPSIFKVFTSKKGFSFIDKLKITYVSFYLYGVTVGEYFKLLFGRQPER